jgi:hypothetical protein
MEPLPRAGALGRTGVGPAAVTIAAWDAGGSALAAAATAWKGVMVREQVRCLLGAGLAGSVDCLLAAEEVAADTGLTTLLGRVRWAWRRGHPPPPAAAGGAAGVRAGGARAGRRGALDAPDRRPTRADPGEVEARVRSAMATLGAGTRTEAALRAAGG